MEWLRWVAAGVATLEAGFMTFDGLRALVVGDYVTPSKGEHAGELGPWAELVSALGVAPRSVAMKSFFVAYGLLWLAVVVAFALRQPWSWTAMLVLAVGSLWYLVAGTIFSIAIVILLLVPAVRAVYW